MAVQRSFFIMHSLPQNTLQLLLYSCCKLSALVIVRLEPRPSSRESFRAVCWFNAVLPERCRSCSLT